MSKTSRILTEAIELQATVTTVAPFKYSNEDLKTIIAYHLTLVIVGEQEKVTNSTIVGKNARQAGAQVEVFPGAGHLLIMEHPRESINNVLAHFLSKNN